MHGVLFERFRFEASEEAFLFAFLFAFAFKAFFAFFAFAFGFAFEAFGAFLNRFKQRDYAFLILRNAGKQFERFGFVHCRGVSVKRQRPPGTNPDGRACPVSRWTSRPGPEAGKRCL